MNELNWTAAELKHPDHPGCVPGRVNNMTNKKGQTEEI